ncbi:MAG: TlpA disulfide reductase family protein [Phycisphaerales bacterium]|nr:TlpA disulfide reductase family protein [Phycisphaerales bacterium]
MTLTHTLAHLGGTVGLALATAAIAQPATPTPPVSPTTPTPAAPAVPAAKDSPAPSVISKEAAELINKAKAAGKAAKDASATVESVMSSAFAGDTTVKGTVVAIFSDAAMPLGHWRIELAAPAAAGAPAATPPAPATPTTGRTFAFDGTTVRAIDPANKEMTETAAADGAAFPEGEEGMLLPMWYMDQRFDRMGRMNPILVEQVIEGEPGSTTIGGVKVTTVRQVRHIKFPSMDEGGDGAAGERTLVETLRLSLGADNYPRRTEVTMEMTGADAGRKQTISQTYTDLKVNSSPSAETFVLKAPEGYKTRTVTVEEGGPQMTVKAGDAALDFNLKDDSGKAHKLADFKGRIVLLDFWATWCGPCTQAMPSIQKIADAFKDKPVSIIGVNTWESSPAAGPAYMKKKGYTYLNLLAGDELAKSYGISGIPTLILIDQEGKVVHIGVGFGPGEEEHLSKLINEKLNPATPAPAAK